EQGAVFFNTSPLFKNRFSAAFNPAQRPTFESLWVFVQVFLLVRTLGFGFDLDLSALVDEDLVLSTRQILLPNYHGAFNPSIIKNEEGGYILIFRYCPQPYWDPWVNYIGACFLNDSFEPISQPELLSNSLNSPCVKSQAEDARVFSFQDRLYLIYNDNVEVSRPWYRDRRDMYLAELKIEKGRFLLSTPLKLRHDQKYAFAFWQKNWTPFVYENCLFLSYSIQPHEILFPDLDDGSCFPCYETKTAADWSLGIIRGSSPAQLVDGEYLAFFHSGHQLTTSISPEHPMWHYFMGAYTFSKKPPFHITKISKKPIVGDGFYSSCGQEKKVILPGGFVVAGSRIIVAFGKDDEEIWIAELDKQKLIDSLIAIDAPCD
ncbi:MAG TPA: hypothetical protein VLE95_07580, partial [Chlamydiales bacterium]|nr:hypothetical protein [Chlamydiales bacterium]